MTERVKLIIQTQEFEFWSSVTIELAIDSFSTVAFSAPFEADRASFREIFRPFKYKPMTLLVDDEVLFTGTMVDIVPAVTPESRSVEVTAYAKPAVMEDCCLPVGAFPLEFNNQKLRDIADRLATFFDVIVEMREADGASFERVAMEPEGKPAEFLAKLAKQRNFIINDTEEGNFRFWRSVTDELPVALFEEGVRPLISVQPEFSPQEYYSEVTGIVPAKGGRAGSKYTVKNAHLTDRVRPLSLKLGDTEDADAPQATRARIGRMFGNMVSYTLHLPTWRDPLGNLWEPNRMIDLLAPGAMIYTHTPLLIRNVTLEQSPESESAMLNVVLPGSFSGEIPETVPWDG